MARLFTPVFDKISKQQDQWILVSERMDSSCAGHDTGASWTGLPGRSKPNRGLRRAIPLAELAFGGAGTLSPSNLPIGLRFDCGRNDVQRMLGNAVPSLVGEVITREIRRQLLGKPMKKKKLQLLLPRRKPNSRSGAG